MIHSLNFYEKNKNKKHSIDECFSLVDEQEIEIEEGGESPGDQPEDGRHSAGRVLLEEVRSEAHQRLSSS